MIKEGLLLLLISSARLQNLRIPTANTVYFSVQQGLGGKQRPAWVSQTTLPHDSTKLHFPPKARCPWRPSSDKNPATYFAQNEMCLCVFMSGQSVWIQNKRMPLWMHVCEASCNFRFSDSESDTIVLWMCLHWRAWGQTRLYSQVRLRLRLGEELSI